MAWMIAAAAIVLAGFFAARWLLLKRSVRVVHRALLELEKDIGQNRQLQLPLPDTDLEKLLISINGMLDALRNERIDYLKKERAFQEQIEAVSHDLRTPLTVINGYLALLQKQSENFSAQQQEMLTAVQRKARKMAELVEQFYEFARMTAGDVDLQMEALDMGKLIRETFLSNCLLLETVGLEVETDFPDHPLWVAGDASALERVFTNLLQNASRYAEHFLRLALHAEAGKAMVCFENDASGLSQEMLQQLFDRFYMNDAARSQGSTGLGLTIAKGLVEEMGGTLEAMLMDEAQPNASATVRFVLHMPLLSQSVLNSK